MSRPEHQAPPEIFYNDSEARKYTTSSRIQSIQSEMAERCLELLNLPTHSQDDTDPFPRLLLDIGCGSGLSGEILTEHGHHWVGVDISGSMLEVALEREVEGDLCLHDIGQGFGFRAGSFDGAIRSATAQLSLSDVLPLAARTEVSVWAHPRSVSVIQWLCNADKTANSPARRLRAFFESLFGALVRGGRAVFQFYPESDDQVRFIMNQANRAGFTGGLVVDYPNSQKAKKFYLVLMTGPSPTHSLPKARTEPSTSANDERVKFSKKTLAAGGSRKNRKKNLMGGGEEKQTWILKKKELYRKRGKEDVPRDSKFTGRKRRTQF